MEKGEWYLRLHEHVRGLMPVQDCIIHDEARGILSYPEAVAVEMPVELEVLVGADGTVQLGSAPPLYYADTSLQPVYHGLKITITLNPEAHGEQTLEP
ncbi:MAG TPA: hypothetical protein VHK69_02745 [Chitinophagaceae bacterium]|jgi:hypothetical protein|nr:hypothetical protein [Chitinophagaceae bacterium]